MSAAGEHQTQQCYFNVPPPPAGLSNFSSWFFIVAAIIGTIVFIKKI